MLAELRGQGEGAAVALSLLLGQARRIDLRTPSLQALALPRVGAGLPAQLLERRPDIAQAEALLAAASADVQAARAALWPRLTLTGSAATSAGRAADWLHAPVATLLAGLAGPIFDGGRLAAQHDAAQARREELLANYHKAIVAAFTDVELALDASASLEEQARAQDEALVQARAALALAESRYRSGAETMLALLDAQRVVTAAQDAQVQIRLARLQAAVSLYRALGGGWRPPEATPMAQAEPLP
jgi:outer membrane protein TolC